ncbi:MAG TPA: enoyl-CoA hydratase [Bryobacteraceae bacterium]|nr:enoyl-CoA hydratase [Bryobacteraceae bacterium]
MTTTEILYDVSEGIATITLNRPDKLNAWTGQMGIEVREAMEAAQADSNVRVIILTGAGRGFCAGADMSLLTELAAKGHDAAAAQVLGHQRQSKFGEDERPDYLGTYSYFPSIKKPVLAAINGHAVGLGFILSLYCDLRFASSEAKFGTAFARRGLIAEYGVAWILPRLIGPANALDLLLSARIIDAAEAQRMGLANRVFPAETFMQNVREYALDLVKLVSPRSMAVIKRQIYHGLLQTLEEAAANAEEEILKSLRSEDFKEGVAHFAEKRPAKFTGR